MRIRVGLIGLGDAWQQRHAPAPALADRFEVRAVCEPVSLRARPVVDEFHAATVAGFQALVQREDVEAVMVLARMVRGIAHSRGLRRRQGGLPRGGIAVRAGRGGGNSVIGSKKPAWPSWRNSRRQAPAMLRLKELIATRLGPPQLVFCHQRLVPTARPATAT